jgi:hypothetical protein
MIVPGAAIWLPGAFAPGFFEKSGQIENLSKNVIECTLDKNNKFLT